MAKRSGGQRTQRQTVNTNVASNPEAGSDAMEQRVLAFAEQLGRVVGTVQAKTEGWMDRDALNEQIAAVRDSASELLEQLKTTASKVTDGVRDDSGEAARSTSAAKSRGRSGGVVDAPGKKHRKPMPKDMRAVAADARTSTMRAGKPMTKTMKRRGRG
jgi:hypothetical protein